MIKSTDEITDRLNRHRNIFPGAYSSAIPGKTFSCLQTGKAANKCSQYRMKSDKVIDRTTAVGRKKTDGRMDGRTYGL